MTGGQVSTILASKGPATVQAAGEAESGDFRAVKRIPATHAAARPLDGKLSRSFPQGDISKIWSWAASGKRSRGSTAGSSLKRPR